MLCHTFRQSASRKAMKLKSLNAMHVIVYLKTYPQPKTIKIIYKIFTKFKDLSTLKIFTRPDHRALWANSSHFFENSQFLVISKDLNSVFYKNIYKICSLTVCTPGK